jgi:hypothetical protein
MTLFVYQPDESWGGGKDIAVRVLLCMCDSGSSVYMQCTQQSDIKFTKMGG